MLVLFNFLKLMQILLYTAEFLELFDGRTFIIATIDIKVFFVIDNIELKAV